MCRGCRKERVGRESSLVKLKGLKEESGLRGKAEREEAMARATYLI